MVSADVAELIYEEHISVFDCAEHTSLPHPSLAELRDLSLALPLRVEAVRMHGWSCPCPTGQAASCRAVLVGINRLSESRHCTNSPIESRKLWLRADEAPASSCRNVRVHLERCIVINVHDIVQHTSLASGLPAWRSVYGAERRPSTVLTRTALPSTVYFCGTPALSADRRCGKATP